MNGKGDSPRNCFSQRFRDNYDLINWNMPTQPPSPCRHPGCSALGNDGSGYCPQHTTERGRTQRDRAYDRSTRATDSDLAMAAQIRSSARWQKMRGYIKAKHPLCCDPFRDHPDRPMPTRVINHIKLLAQHPELAFVETNLAPLCSACDGKIKALELKGESTEQLFEEFVRGIEQ